MPSERPVTDVLRDILQNLQEMVRAEMRLARAEIRSDLSQAASSGLWIAAGSLAALCSLMFLLWSASYALATVMAMWAAALLVAVVVGIIAAVSIVAGIRKFRQIQLGPERTVETLKENLEWMKQSVK